MKQAPTPDYKRNGRYFDSYNLRRSIVEIAQAQEDVRRTFLGVFAGQLVSAVLWGISAAACTWYSLHLGAIILVLGGFLIFPLTQLLLRSMGHDYALPKGHPMNALGMQVAFILPLTLPVVIGIATLRPACAHVIPPSQLLGLSPATVQRKWSTARIWLYHQLSRPES